VEDFFVGSIEFQLDAELSAFGYVRFPELASRALFVGHITWANGRPHAEPGIVGLVGFLDANKWVPNTNPHAVPSRMDFFLGDECP
jgi:hypothetical protein